jgi:hypothetical protein
MLMILRESGRSLKDYLWQRIGDHAHSR